MTQPPQQTPPPSNDNKPEKSGKEPEKPSSPGSSTFWYLMIGGVVLAMMISYVGGSRMGERLTLSEFEQGLDSGTFHSENVHELVFNTDSITFQNQPKEANKEPASESTEAAATPTQTNPDAPSTENKTPAETKPETDSVAKTETTAETEDELKKFYISIYGIVDQDRSALKTKLAEAGIGYDGSTRPAPLENFLMMGMLVASVVLLVVMFRRIGGAGGALSFGRSRGKLYANEEVGTTFKDVAGIDEAVNELKEIVEFLRKPDKYQALGGRIPRGVLLVGPPGTGKTLLAKAVAGEAGVPFYSLSGSDFVEMFVGVGAARVRDTFQQALQRSPSIIFIDELDALGKARGSGMPGGHDEREQTLNALLVEMDGFGSDKSVIVMGATNRPETLDPALLRPGRFDRNVLVDKPDYKGREAILKVHAKSVRMSDDVDFNRLARLSPGFSGADLANLVNEAALLAGRNDRKSVSMKEFEEAIERVVAGLEKTTRLLVEDEKVRVAYHECGHALAAISLPNTDPVHKISIIPRGFGALGYMLQRPTDDRFLVTQSELENKICVLLGGIVTEQVVFNETSTGASNDLQRATDIARSMVTNYGMSPTLGRVNYNTNQPSPFLGTGGGGNEHSSSEQTLREIDLEIKRIVNDAYEKVNELITTQREILEHMAKDLIEMEVMDSDHIDSILKQYKTGPQIKPGTFIDRPAPETPASESDASEEGNGGINQLG